ncbi:hypothetical protein [Actinoplanes sp. NPDC023714]|uniref:hypothetical protein n=1 Tax=Actinoplanes sp. NPDC023714 TaxID=3154322 RepID=UPI0033C6CC24
MADGLTATESAILIVLMAEAREVLNTELRDLYGLDVRKPQRERLKRLKYITSTPSGRTNALALSEDGWALIKESDLGFPGAGAPGAALAALQHHLRDRVLDRAGCANFVELFALSDIRSGRADRGSAEALRLRIVGSYNALADEPQAWVSLRRLRPFFPDLSKSDLDDGLRRLHKEGGVNFIPEPDRRVLTEADAEASLRLGNQDTHLLAIGV